MRRSDYRAGFVLFCFSFFTITIASAQYTNISTISGQSNSPYALAFNKTLHYINNPEPRIKSNVLDKSSLGINLRHELPPLGPESFCGDAKGNLYVCDSVNKRIVIFDRSGGYSDSFDLSYTPNDITIDDLGNLYIYSAGQKALYQYDKNNSLFNTIQLNVERIINRGPIHIVKSSIYMVNNDQEELLLGSIENGVLVQPSSSKSSLPTIKGIFGESGRRYFIHVSRKIKADIVVTGTNGLVTNATIIMNGIVSANFLGEDRSGNFYIQTESIKDSGFPIALAIHKCNSQGKVLNTLFLPETLYQVPTVKLLSINKNGRIFQFAPSRETAAINVFADPTNNEEQ